MELFYDTVAKNVKILNFINIKLSMLELETKYQWWAYIKSLNVGSVASVEMQGF